MGNKATDSAEFLSLLIDELAEMLENHRALTNQYYRELDASGLDVLSKSWHMVLEKWSHITRIAFNPQKTDALMALLPPRPIIFVPMKRIE